MQTYTVPKPLVADPGFSVKRIKALNGLDLSMIDTPIVDIIESFTKITHCYTLQCCWGHFVHDGQPEREGLEPLAHYNDNTEVEYRIAYIAFHIENSKNGEDLIEDLSALQNLDPQNIQFCCADWFWNQQVNTYAIQVEPDRFKKQDTAMLCIAEALYIEKLRKQFFDRLRDILPRHQLL